MPFPRRTWLARFAMAATLALPVAPALAQTAGAAGPTVFAAASLKNALDDVAARWAATGKGAPRISYAASNTLARQIEQGAPADLFLSADLDWMDYAESRKLIRPETRVTLLGNTLVLVAPKGAPVQLAVGPGMDLAGALGPSRLAMGTIEAVPAGKYGRAALEALGAWDGVKDKVAQADSVRAALLLVSRGEAALGIVYATDAAADPNVVVVGTFPAGTHPPIVYPAAVTRDAANPDAAAFLAFLRSAPARSAFERQGFRMLAAPASGS